MTALVPVKRLATAKSRLALPDDARHELVLAFAADTLRAVSESALIGTVVVVSADPTVIERLRRPGVQVVPDLGSGLDDAIALGVHAAVGSRGSQGVVVVPADLPCLRAQDVTQVLTRTRESASFVPDRSGTGTTMVFLPPGPDRINTRYGPGSAERHRALGFVAMADAPVRARHDVDTRQDLDQALELGVGQHTLDALEALPLLDARH